MSLASPSTPSESSQASSRNSEEDVLRLGYLSVLRARWKLVTISSVLAGLVGLVSAWLSSPLYEARATILVTEPRQRESWRSQNVMNVRAMLESLALASQVISEFGLDKPPREMTPEAFLKGGLRIDEVKGTDVLRITVCLPEPELAALVANRIAELGAEMNRRVNRAEVQFVQGVTTAEIEKARAQMKNAQERLLAYKESAQVELARKDIESKLGQRGNLIGLQVELEAERARLATAEEELAKQTRVLTIKRSIDADPLLTEVARTTSNPGASVVGLELREELVNQLYEVLANQVAASRTKVSALQTQLEALTRTLKVGAVEVPALSQLYKKESELAKLDLEYDLAKRVYSVLVGRLEEANYRARSTEIQLVDAAMKPARPLPRRRLLSLALGLLAGLALSSLLAFFLEHVARARNAPKRFREGVH